MNIKPVFLYSDYPSKSLNIDNIIESLSKLNINSKFKGDFFDYLKLSKNEQEELSDKISQTHIYDIEKEKYQLDSIPGKQIKNNRVLFDGFLFTKVINKYFISSPYQIDRYLNIVFTNRLLCTFENNRYHARVVLLGYPSFISTSGIVEAPAKPREYYWLKAEFIRSGKNIEELDELFKGKYVEYDDPKITDILFSYTLQAIFYELTGEAFCSNKKCCLYNSHLQEGVLEIQYKGKLCEKHKQIFENLS